MKLRSTRDFRGPTFRAPVHTLILLSSETDPQGRYFLPKRFQYSKWTAEDCRLVFRKLQARGAIAFLTIPDSLPWSAHPFIFIEGLIGKCRTPFHNPQNVNFTRHWESISPYHNHNLNHHLPSEELTKNPFIFDVRSLPLEDISRAPIWYPFVVVRWEDLNQWAAARSGLTVKVLSQLKIDNTGFGQSTKYRSA
jgi:hypothetical protein